jgi:hypothetical protein
LQNLPGSLDFLITRTAESVSADYILIDMSPGLGSVNQNLVAISHYLILPTSPDVFSVMAIDSLSRVLPRWRRWAAQAGNMPVLRDAAYPFAPPKTRVLGTIVQKFRPRYGRPAQAFQKWIDELEVAVRDRLRPELRTAGMLLPPSVYADAGVDQDSLNLATISDFNSLISRSQEYLTPVFALSDQQLSAVGDVLSNFQKARQTFHDDFSLLASRVDAMTIAGETSQ